MDKPYKDALNRRARAIDALARTRLSNSYLLRDFLFSSEAAAARSDNLPEDPGAVIRAGHALCQRVLEPIREQFGPIAITFGYQCRKVIERGMSPTERRLRRASSAPHQWDRGTFGQEVYARIDLLPFCVEDLAVNKSDFGHWVMHNLDIDLLMQWTRSNVFCITIGPRPRRVWLEWGRPSHGEPRMNVLMGASYWQRTYPSLAPSDRPKFGPSHTQGRIQWSSKNG
jgi:hypothetical protein